MMYLSTRWPAICTCAPFYSLLGSALCVCVRKSKYTVHIVHMCVYGHVHVYTLKKAKAFQLPHGPALCPLSWGGGQRHYSAIKLLFAGVTLSRGCVDRGGNALKVRSYTHIYPSGRGVWGPGTLLWLPGLMGHNRGQWGSRRVRQFRLRGEQQDTGGQHVWAGGEATTTPFHPWLISLVSLLFALFPSPTAGTQVVPTTFLNYHNNLSGSPVDIWCIDLWSLCEIISSCCWFNDL